jgi:hypothetical protein
MLLRSLYKCFLKLVTMPRLLTTGGCLLSLDQPHSSTEDIGKELLDQTISQFSEFSGISFTAKPGESLVLSSMAVLKRSWQGTRSQCQEGIATLRRSFPLLWSSRNMPRPALSLPSPQLPQQLTVRPQHLKPHRTDGRPSLQSA